VRIDRPAAIARVIPTCQPRRELRIRVKVISGKAIFVGSASAAAGTILYGDNGTDHLGIDLQLLSTGQTGPELPKIALLHERQDLINPATGLALIGAAIGFANPPPAPARAWEVAIRIMEVMAGNPHLFEIVLALCAVGGFAHLLYRR